MLKPNHEVVAETHDDNITTCVSAPPLVGPKVEDVVQVDVRKQRRCRCSLGNAFLTGRPRPVLDDPCGHPLLDQPQDPPISNPVLKKPLQPAMVKAGEELADIRVEHPVHLLAHDPDRQGIQRVMRGASRPKPIRESEEVLFVDRVQHLDDRPLDDLVLQRCDTKRPEPPVRLGDEHPLRRLRSVTPRMNPVAQIP